MARKRSDHEDDGDVEPGTLKHTWDGRSITFSHVSTLDGQTRHRRMPIDFENYPITENTFLRAVLRSIPCPVHLNYLNPFRAVLRDLYLHPDAVRVLGMEPSKVRSPDILNLFACIEEVISTWGGDSLYSRSNQACWIFRAYGVDLADGRTIRTSGFKSRFDVPRRRPRTSIAGAFNEEAHGSTRSLRPASTTTNYDSLAERDSIYHREGKATKDRISMLCQNVFEAHKAFKARLIALKNLGLPSLRPKIAGVLKRGGKLTPAVFSELPEETQLRVALHMIEREQLYKKAPLRGQYIPLMGISELKAHMPSVNARHAYEALLSDYFLPRHVVTACNVALMTANAWNSQTVASLTGNSVRRTPTGYQLIGLKRKTDQSYSEELSVSAAKPESETEAEAEAAIIDTISDKIAIEALELLLEHAKSIEALFDLRDVPLISTRIQRHSGKQRFSIGNLNRNIEEFCNFVGLPQMLSSELRELWAHVEILSPDGDIFTVNAQLRHRHLLTTEIYLNSVVMHDLYESNIRRFMKMLASSILFVTNRKGDLAKTGREKKADADAKLLFPISHHSPDAALLDQWIAAAGNLTIGIGLEEIELCAYQHLLYSKDVSYLANSNSTRFVNVHLPRIFFCFAMRKIILASPHKGVYRKFERALA